MHPLAVAKRAADLVAAIRISFTTIVVGEDIATEVEVKEVGCRLVDRSFIVVVANT